MMYLKIYAQFLLLVMGIAFSTWPFEAQSQLLFKKQHSIPVRENNKVLKYPWIGGFNNAQFSGADLNNDGIQDLVVFDRTGDRLVTFLNNGTPDEVDYTYAPEYEKGFPELHHWVLMDDFNCDGVSDIFTSTPGQIDYYRGRFNANNKIEFDSITYFRFNSFSGLLNIFVSAADIPAIADINGDGDLDVLTFQLFSGGVEEYYENMSQELTGTCGDTVIFQQRSDCWGNFFETNFRVEVLLDSCGGVAPRDTCEFTPKRRPHTYSPRHSGSTSLLFDEDGDGDKELILGDITFSQLNRLVNGGDQNCAFIVEQDTAYPSYDVSFQMPVFPASFYVDVDNDNLKDLIAAPNDPQRSENYNCIWFYKNVGTQDSVVFAFQTDTFLLDQSVDFGEGAYPVFFDHNNDGLMDVVVGNDGYYIDGTHYRSSLALLENVGSAAFPEFELVDRDYANLAGLMISGVHPAFGDLDNDGDKDMLIGDKEGKVHYFENTAGPGMVASFVLAEPEYQDIDVGQIAVPYIYDVNGDSLPDLVIGERNGNLNYFENRSATDTFTFSNTPTNGFFGHIDVRKPGFPTQGFSTVVFSPLDSTGKMYVLCGSYVGSIKAYVFDRDSIYAGSFMKNFDAYSGIDEGERTSLTIADLTNDGKLEMIVGNYRGGLSLFSQSDSIAQPIGIRDVAYENLEFQLFPNPANERVTLEIKGALENSPMEITVLDMLGRTLQEQYNIRHGRLLQLDTGNLKSGIYFVKVRIGSRVGVKKLMVEKR